MDNKDKSQKILGAIAFASTTLFIFKSRKNGENKKIDGLNIEIDPEKIVDKIKPYISDNPRVNEFITNIAKDKISKLLG